MTFAQDIRYCTSHDGVRIAHTASGTGPPLVRAGTWLSHLDCDARHSEPLAYIRALSESHTYVRYDSRGCGLSDRKPPSMTFEDGVRDLEAVVDAQGLERFALLGISMGAATSVAYAVRHPERVTHLVLLGGFAASVFSTPGASQKAIDEAELVIRGAEVGWGSVKSIFRKLFVAQLLGNPTAAQQAELEERMQLSMTADVAAAYLRANYSIDVVGLCAQVKVPTLIFHCRQDETIRFDQGLRIASLIPGARFVPLEAQGHILLSTEPAMQVFRAEVAAFLGTGAGRAQLTVRQAEVLRMVAQGHTDKLIAKALDLSPRTVEMHVSGALKALHCATRAEAVHRAGALGLLRG
ncbi:alpha/beta fold hydrolase [Acidovorax sp. BL-A-41-H1]|uniref:alpha/beta fold hydrolase n=1 Tax=Acidovorax sp. BL-A-41-H1 TaxID=3421102 RepID=UPI003F7AB59F